MIGDCCVTEKSGGSNNRRALAWMTAACAIIGLAARLVYLRHPWDGDAGMFVVSGRAMASGARFCHEIYDNKFPTAALWSALWWRICGLFWPGYVIGGAVMAGATCVLLARIARRHASPAAFWPTLLFSLVYANFCPVVFGGFQSETALTFFATLAASFALDALAGGRAMPAFVCGLAAGVAAYIKPNGIGVVGVFGLIATFHRSQPLHKKVIQIIAVAVGLAIPLAAAVLYLYAADTLRDMPWLYRQISGYARQSVWDRFSAIKIGVAVLFVAVPLWLRAKRPRDSKTSFSLLTHFAALWLLIEFVAVAMQGRMYSYHFLIIAAPASLLFGAIARPFSLRSVAVPLIPAALFSIWGIGWQFVRPEVPRLPVSDYLITHARPGDSVWLDNLSRVVLETNLNPGARYMQTFPFFNTDTAPLEMGPLLIDDLATRRPRFVILPTDVAGALDRHCAFMAELSERPLRQKNFRTAWLAVVAYVQSHYHPTDQVDDRTVYVLVD